MENLFSDIIITWFQQNKRDLPWRHTKDPYKIWLSEIILQQTRVTQGLPYYENFVKTYPKLKDLAEASEQDVLKLWQGLGYYSRARNMHFTARNIYNDLNGKFPNTYKELLKLKGVGDYTASAIASFCYNEKTPVLDGNVFRVLARFFGIETPINTGKAKKEFKALAVELIDFKNPGLFNQALMEFGALQCTPSKPDCQNCPLNDTCVALQKKQVAILPQKENKIKIRKRFFNYLVVDTKENKTYIQKREGKGIWQNLYEFPLVETEVEIDFDQLIRNSDFLNFVKDQNYNMQLLTPKVILHKLSHQHLHIKYWLLELESFNKKTIRWQKVSKFPFPIVIHSFIEEFIEQKK